jgi:hypothetical protein
MRSFVAGLVRLSKHSVPTYVKYVTYVGSRRSSFSVCWYQSLEMAAVTHLVTRLAGGVRSPVPVRARNPGARQHDDHARLLQLYPRDMDRYADRLGVAVWEADPTKIRPDDPNSELDNAEEGL